MGNESRPGETNGPFVTISNRDIWNKLNEIEDKVDDIVRAELPKRVRGLELKFYAILAGVLGGIVTILYILQQGTAA